MSNPITPRGKLKLEEELNQLIRVDRENIKKAIGSARELGDLKENAEYHSAKEKQSQIEGRIMQLQGALASCQVIDVTNITSTKIVFGATVTLFDTKKESEIVLQIVGQDEANFEAGRVSFVSPLGRALIGKESGDTVIVKAPKGDIEYEIISFEFIS